MMATMVLVAGYRRCSAGDDIASSRASGSGASRFPAGFLGDRFDRRDVARLTQMLEPELDGIGAAA